MRRRFSRIGRRAREQGLKKTSKLALERASRSMIQVRLGSMTRGGDRTERKVLRVLWRKGAMTCWLEA